MQVLNYHLRRYGKPSYKEVEVLTRLSEMLVNEEAKKKILELLEEAYQRIGELNETSNSD